MPKRPSSKKKNRAARSKMRDMPELQQARALWIHNRFRESLEMFDKAVRKEPGNPMALADAARAFGSRYEIDRSERLLARLVEIGQNRPELLKMAGQSYRMIQRPQKAIDCLEQATALDHGSLETQLELAMLYERRHDLDLAKDQVDACLENYPNSNEAKFLRGRLKRRQGESEDARRDLSEVAESDAAHWSVAAQAWHELAQLLDETEEYDAAFEAVLAAKQRIAAHADDERKRAEKESAHLQSLLSGLTAGVFQEWIRNCNSDDHPTLAFLTGPPRSGTTLLEKVLDGHPEIVTSDEQIAFPKFIYPAMLGKRNDALLSVDDLDGIATEVLDSQRARYLRYVQAALGEALNGRVHIDKNPSTLPLVPGMLRLWPFAKLIVALRDPRDVIISCFMRYLPLNTVSAQFLTIEGTVRHYLRDIQMWFRLREMIPQQWIEVRYEDTVEDVERVSRRCMELLQLPWEEAVLDYRQQLQRRPTNSPTYEDVAKPIYRNAVARWRNYQGQLEAHLPALNAVVERLGYDDR